MVIDAATSIEKAADNAGLSKASLWSGLPDRQQPDHFAGFF